MLRPAKVMGSFFLNSNFSVSNKIVGQLFVCLSVFGLVVTSWN